MIATMRPCVTLQLPLQTGHASSLAGASVLLIGNGYVAHALAPVLRRAGATVHVTTRSAGKSNDTGSVGFGTDRMRMLFANADFVLTSVPPGKAGPEPVLDVLNQIESAAKWIGYLSATSVYGDRNGQWAFEGEAPTPGLARGFRRANAELAWIEAFPQTQIFRLAGIYGPGRAPFAKIFDGTARIIDAPGHVVNRIYIDDIVSALLASMTRPSPQNIYNIADGHPAPPGDVLAYAATLVGQDTPPIVALSDAAVSTMAGSFYAESKRIDIAHARTRLQWEPRYQSYKEGLQAILKAGEPH